MIVCFTPNPALDMTYTLDRLELGESQRVEAAHVRAGGKGINVARVLHQTGRAVTAVTTAGGETGDRLRDGLDAAGIPTRIIPVSASTRRSVALVETVGGRTTLLNERGDSLSDDDWIRVDATLGGLMPDAECVTGSGSVPEDAPSDVYARLVTAAAAHDVPAVVDASGEHLLRAAEAGAAVLKPNRAELAASTGQDDPVAGARRLLDAGAECVIVSLGEEGMIGVERHALESIWHARLPEPLVGNPTGAGDAAVAALAASLAGGIRDLPALLRTATAWSASAVLMPHAGDLDPDYREREAGVRVDRI